MCFECIREIQSDYFRKRFNLQSLTEILNNQITVKETVKDIESI